MSAYTDSFATAGAIELGVTFTADVAGTVTGIRFYKGPKNTGTHTGSLWNASGSRLATGTFSGETATGWQQVTFSGPVPVLRLPLSALPADQRRPA